MSNVYVKELNIFYPFKISVKGSCGRQATKNGGLHSSEAKDSCQEIMTNLRPVLFSLSLLRPAGE